MIDGVKIKCTGTPPEKWTNNPLLNFSSKVNQQTGELLNNTQMAFYKGLQFKITNSTISETGFLLTVRGSLASFYNEGKNNAFDFDLIMLSEVIKELEQKFCINPKQAQITAFEFGGNIQPKQSIKRIIQGLRAYQNNNFTGLKMDNVFNGLQLKRQNTTFKLYDKGLQTNKPQSNILRLEYCLKYSKAVNKYGFYVLNDLLDIKKLDSIKRLLLEVWANSIFFDNQYKRQTIQRMTAKQRQKFLLYLDNTFWSDQQTKMQRKRAKDNFKALCNEFNTSSTQTDVLELLTQKLDKLTALKCYPLQKFEQANKKPKKETKMLPFTSLDKPVNGNEKHPKKGHQKSNQENPKKAPKKKTKKCCVCGANISHKKASAVYCSKKCNNSKQALKRKRQRHKLKKAENKKLPELITNLNKTNLPLLIEYKHKNNVFADHLEQNEINAPNYWIRKITRVTIQQKHPIILTGWNAKRLIKAITRINPP